jgi:peptidoglycan hydrolase-like protein with peptidoglycan-binding domain
MALPLIPLLIAGSVGGYYFWPKAKPALQSLRRVTPTGVPIQIVVPTATKPISPNTKSTLDTTQPALITPTGASNIVIQTNQDVQRALNALGFGTPTLTVDGQIGPLSIAAIKRYQVTVPMSVDGAVTGALKTALQNSLRGTAFTKSPPVFTGPPVSSAPIGSGGTADIQSAQAMLNQLGASPQLAEDGKVGPITVAAIKAFQLAHGLVVSGVVNASTISELKNAFTPGAAVYTGYMPDTQPTGPGDITPAVEGEKSFG